MSGELTPRSTCRTSAETSSSAGAAGRRAADDGGPAQQRTGPVEAFGPEERVAPAEGGPPRMSDRRGSARQRELLKVGDSAVAGEIADEDLTAPQPAVVPVAEAVHADADDGVLPAVLDQPRRDVRVVVLHGHLLLLRQRQCVLRRQVLRVEVVGDHLGLEPEEATIDLDAGLVVLQRLQVLEVADVLAEEGVGVAREAEGVLELGAGRQRLRERPRQGHRERGVAPGPADQPRPAAAHLRDGVVVAHGDLPVVHQIGVGDRRQPVDLLPAFDDRLLRQVAAGHDQRPAGGLQEQHVERRVREHRAEVALAESDLLVHRVAVSRARLGAGLTGGADSAPLKQHDRVFRRREQLGLCGVRRDSARASSSRPANMTASGLSGRRLRSFRRRTASPSVASQARWKPPRPLTARISPAHSRSAASRMGAAGPASPPAASSITPSPCASRRSSRTRGPHTGHALGSA